MVSNVILYWFTSSRGILTCTDHTPRWWFPSYKNPTKPSLATSGRSSPRRGWSFWSVLVFGVLQGDDGWFSPERWQRYVGLILLITYDMKLCVYICVRTFSAHVYSCNYMFQKCRWEDFACKVHLLSRTSSVHVCDFNAVYVCIDLCRPPVIIYWFACTCSNV